ncbi:hypothetical protein PPYR_09757 [Photinus pyralis]|uniref:Uncharacterized protein n=1 Tax=Photinus pyralis TaxID=7054 RepID=A0A5N4AEF3_PHOPY|nr:uncharacterized protein LOC116174998 [Photinus pyralis]KAB0795696.1 hypothetical protein PPYR_09757 [Photinus pyralis]
MTKKEKKVKTGLEKIMKPPSAEFYKQINHDLRSMEVETLYCHPKFAPRANNTFTLSNIGLNLVPVKSIEEYNDLSSVNTLPDQKLRYFDENFEEIRHNGTISLPKISFESPRSRGGSDAESYLKESPKDGVATKFKCLDCKPNTIVYNIKSMVCKNKRSFKMRSCKQMDERTQNYGGGLLDKRIEYYYTMSQTLLRKIYNNLRICFKLLILDMAISYF